MNKCRELGVDSPVVLIMDKKHHRIFMEFVEGETVRDYLRKIQLNDEKGLFFLFFLLFFVVFSVVLLSLFLFELMIFFRFPRKRQSKDFSNKDWVCNWQVA
jgi:hypothetical protein